MNNIIREGIMDIQFIAPEYMWTLMIPSFDTGQDGRLRLSSQLRLQQEAGERHFLPGGLGFQGLLEQGMAFVITRLNTRIVRAPLAQETVQLKTWHRAAKGAQFFRCYQFLDEQGRALINSVSAFALVDPQTHRLLRPSVFQQFGIPGQPDRYNDCPDPARWTLPEALVPSGERTVRWSDIDYNGHLNNAVYADIVCDALPGGMHGRRITGFSLAFLHEALQEETIRLCSSLTESSQGQQAWVTGEHSRGRCFEACVEFEQEKG